MRKNTNGLSDRVFLREEVVFDGWTQDDLNLFLFLVRHLPTSDGIRDRKMEITVHEFVPFFGQSLPSDEIMRRIMSFSRKGIAFLRTYYDEIRKREYTERDGYSVVTSFFMERRENLCSGEMQEIIQLVFLGLLAKVYDRAKSVLSEEYGMKSLFDDAQMLISSTQSGFVLPTKP